MSTISFNYLFAVIFVSFCNAAPTTTHTSLPSCKIKNANVNECLKTYFQEAIKYSKQGNPKLSIPPLDPYFIPKIVMEARKSEGINVEMRNSSVHGLSKATFTKVQSDPSNGVFDIHYVTPATKFSGYYDLSGKLFSIPINGKGKSDVTLYELNHVIKIRGDIKTKSDGNKYLSVKSVSAHLKPQKMKLRFDQLFRENNELGEMVNQMMNDNWQDIYAKLQPRMEEDMAKDLFRITTNIFNSVPYNEIFPDV